MKKVILMLATASLLLTVQSCKKGENDPFLSLKTRNARITGTWELKKSVFRSMDISTSGGVTNTSVTNETYENGAVTQYDSLNGTLLGSSTGTPYTLEFDINKDGSYTSRMIQNGDMSENTGSWWWEDSKKKKTRIALDDDWGSFQIDRLKNKEMVWILEESFKDTYTNGDMDESIFTQRYEFEKKK